MRISSAVVTGLVCGVSLAAVAAWNSGSQAKSSTEWTPEWTLVLGELTASGDPFATVEAQEGPARPRVVCIDDRQGTLAAALRADDPRMAPLCRALRWSPPDADLRAELGIHTAPHLVLVHGEDPIVLDACEPVGGARPDAFAVRHALARFRAHEGAGRLAELRSALAADPDAADVRLDTVRLLEAAGCIREAAAVLREGTARERSSIGPLHRASEHRAALALGPVEEPCAALVERLRSESDPRVLRAGWALVATLRADASARQSELWQAIRETYQRVQERDLVPMLELLLAQFQAAPNELDAADRYFLKGRAKALAALSPKSPWPRRALAAIETR